MFCCVNSVVSEVLCRQDVCLMLGFRIEPVLSNTPLRDFCIQSLGLVVLCADILLAQIFCEQVPLWELCWFLLDPKPIYCKKSTTAEILATMQRPRGSSGLYWCEKRLRPLHCI